MIELTIQVFYISIEIIDKYFTFTVVGLLFDIFGAWFLAYDILWGYIKFHQSEQAKVKLKNSKQILSDLLENTEKLSKPPYTDDEINKIKNDYLIKYNKINEKNINEINSYTYIHKDKSMIKALIGISLLTIGFILQIIGSF